MQALKAEHNFERFCMSPSQTHEFWSLMYEYRLSSGFLNSCLQLLPSLESGFTLESAQLHSLSAILYSCIYPPPGINLGLNPMFVPHVCTPVGSGNIRDDQMHYFSHN